MTTISATGEQLIEWVRIRISGDDARTYLQGQITQDVESLVSGSWTFILQPDSSVLGVGWISMGNESVFLDVPRDRSEQLVSRLRRFILRSKVVVETIECADPVLRTYSEAFEINFPISLPSQDLTPHSFGQDWISRAISFTKGCYTGQELVGRLDARQAPVPFRVVRLVGKSQTEVESVVNSGNQAAKQTILWGFPDQGSFKAATLLHRTCLAPEYRAQFQTVDFLDINS